MRLLGSLALLAGCAAVVHRQDVSPRFAELAPRRIGVLVAGLDEPRDARARIDRFAFGYPDPIEPATAVPREGPRATLVSRLLADALIARLRDRGYDAHRVEGTGRVGDALAPDRRDAVLAVLYRAADRWPVSELEGTTALRVGDTHERTFEYVHDVERGLLLLATAYLLDARTSLRLWSRRTAGLAQHRIPFDSEVRRMGAVLDPGEQVAWEDLAPRAVGRLVAAYFDAIPPAAPPRPPPSPADRRALEEEARVDRYRHEGRLLVDVAAIASRRSFGLATALAGGGTTETGEDAFGPLLGVEVGVRALGRRWLHGGALSLAHAWPARTRTLVASDAAGSRSARLSPSGATAIEAAWVLGPAWQPRRRLLLSVGAGAAVGAIVARVESAGASTDDGLRVPIGPLLQADAWWLGERLSAGPFARGEYAWDVKEGGAGAAWTAGARVGWSY